MNSAIVHTWCGFCKKKHHTDNEVICQESREKGLRFFFGKKHYSDSDPETLHLKEDYVPFKSISFYNPTKPTVPSDFKKVIDQAFTKYPFYKHQDSYYERHPRSKNPRNKRK